MNLVQSSFSWNLTVLRVLGLYPQKNHSKLYLIYGYIMLFCCLLPDPILSVVYYIQDKELDFLDAGVNLFVIVAMIVFVPKNLPFIFNSKEIRECLYYLQIFVKVALNEKQKDIINETVWICRRNSRFVIISFAFDNLMWLCRPLFFPNRGFPMEVWLPFDPTTNSVVFYCVYFFVAMGGTYTVYNTAAIDTLISGLAYHAAGQIKILKDNLQFLLEYAEKISRDRNEVVFQKIRECTQHHHHIICFVRKIEDCFSWIIFSQILTSTLSICFCCFQLSQVEPGSGTFFLMAVYLVSTLFQVYFYCYYGATLHEESNTLTTAVYLGRWYEYDLKSQKALVFFMERAKVPMTVTAGKVLELSLETFMNILKKAYSLLAVLENY